MCIYTRNCHHSQEHEYMCHPFQSPPCVPGKPSLLSLYSPCHAATKLPLSLYTGLHFLEYHIHSIYNFNKYSICAFIWLLSCNIIILRPICVVVSIVDSFLVLHSSSLYGNTTVYLSIYLLM